ncbi:MAG: glucose-1-phosphate adenylyltransferase [Fibrobacterota bacterium]|nr:glucose-1-phosphate adenylyltransferase [Fibrobacterota bacterium]
MENLLAMILAGGQGSRLQPLTNDRAKPAVHFAGKYRVIDFVLNNFVNSGFYQIKILTQFKSDSLNRHVSQAWDLNRNLDQFVDLVPAQMRIGNSWYMGTADAIYQNVNLIRDVRPDHVAVFGGDHIYKMAVNQMLQYHISKGALATISCIPVPQDEARDFGVVEVDDYGRMIGFEEKPSRPKSMPGRPGWSLASMGNYMFNSKFLVRELLSDSKLANSHHDFGKDILPSIYNHHPVYVYDFNENRIKGENDASQGYWKDIGTLEAFYEANMDCCAVSPIFNLYNNKWPLRTINWNLPPAKFVFGESDPEGRKGIALDSIVCEGCICSGGRAIHSILSPGCQIHSHALITDSILFPNVDVGRGARINRAIIEKGIKIPPGFEVGVNLDKDRERFHVTDTGIVVIAKDTVIEG